MVRRNIPLSIVAYQRYPAIKLHAGDYSVGEYTNGALREPVIWVLSSLVWNQTYGCKQLHRVVRSCRRNVHEAAFY